MANLGSQGVAECNYLVYSDIYKLQHSAGERSGRLAWRRTVLRATHIKSKCCDLSRKVILTRRIRFQLFATEHKNNILNVNPKSHPSHLSWPAVVMLFGLFSLSLLNHEDLTCPLHKAFHNLRNCWRKQFSGVLRLQKTSTVHEIMSPYFCQECFISAQSFESLNVGF